MRALLISLLLLLTLLCLSGCGDDSNNDGGTNPPSIYDADSFDYAVVITEWTSDYRGHHWEATIVPVDSTGVIESLVLRIDGEDVPLNGSCCDWIGDMGTLTGGQSYSLEAIIDGTTYTEDITIAHWPETTLPDTWDTTQSLELNWTMAGNNMWQSIRSYYWYWITDETSYGEVEMGLSTRARSATVPANWITIPDGTSSDVNLSIVEVNWAYNNRFLVLSAAENDESYYDMTKRNERARQHLDTVLDLLGN